MKGFWCSLGVCLVGDAVVFDVSFLVNCVLFWIVDCQKNSPNSPYERFLVEDLGFPGEAPRL